jgi:hypothetical protein
MKLKFTRRQKIRVWQGEIDIYDSDIVIQTDHGKVVPEQFDDISIYNATVAAMAEIQSLRNIGHSPIISIYGNFAGRTIQVDLI